jgi:2-polyprenyl-3-methyl-5-hydroxy-6-metoxy-1,4-benzoquinol methylase
MLKSVLMSKKLYEEFHKTTAAQFKTISKNNFTYRLILDVAEKYLTKDKRVLDIGCGAGTICFYIANKGNNTLAFDISKKAIKACQESSRIMGLDKLARFKVVDFPNETVKEKFDLIIFSEVIEHLSDDNLALIRIYSMLNNNGILIITTPSKHAPLHRLGYAMGFDKRVGHLRRYTIDDLSVQCKNVGFKIIKTQKIEGILRNFLFLNPIAGKFVRFVKYFISDIVTFVDTLTIPIFGESNIIIVAQRKD